MSDTRILSAVPTRKRNGFVTFCLWFGTIANAIGTIGYLLLLGSDKGLFSGYAEPLEYRLGWIAVSLVATIGGWMMIKWQKLGFYLAAGALICGGFTTFGAYEAPVAVGQSVLSAGLLFAILQIKADGVSCWRAMDGVDKSPLFSYLHSDIQKRLVSSDLQKRSASTPEAEPGVVLDVAEIKNCKALDGNIYRDFGTLMLSYIFPNPQVKMRVAGNDCRTLADSLQAPGDSAMPVYINGSRVEAGGPEIVSRIKMELVNVARNDATGNLARLLINCSDIKTFWTPLFPMSEGQFNSIVREAGRQLSGYACLT